MALDFDGNLQDAIDTFCNVSLDGDDTVTALNHIVLTVGCGESTIFDVIIGLEKVFTSKLPLARKRGIQLLYDILDRVTDIQLSSKQLELLIVIISQRLKDWHCVKGSLQSLIAIFNHHCDLLRQIEPSNTQKPLIQRLFLDINTDVHAPSYAQSVRYSMLEILTLFIKNFSVELEPLCPSLLDLVMQQCEDEKDPRNLALVFPLLADVFTIYKTHLSKSHADRAADILTAYYPITYKAPTGDPFAVSEETIKAGLHRALFSHTKLAPEVIPFFLECIRLASEPTAVQVTETVDLTLKSLRSFGSVFASSFMLDVVSIIDEEGAVINPGRPAASSLVAPQTCDLRTLMVHHAKSSSLFNSYLPEYLRLIGGMSSIACSSRYLFENEDKITIPQRLIKSQTMITIVKKISNYAWYALLKHDSHSSHQTKFQLYSQIFRVLSEECSKTDSNSSLFPHVMGSILSMWVKGPVRDLVAVYLGREITRQVSSEEGCGKKNCHSTCSSLPSVSQNQTESSCCKSGGDVNQTEESRRTGGCCQDQNKKQDSFDAETDKKTSGGCCGGNSSQHQTLIHKIHETPLGESIPLVVSSNMLNNALNILCLLAMAVSDSEADESTHQSVINPVLTLVEDLVSSAGADLFMLSPELSLTVIRTLSACVSHNVASPASVRSASILCSLLPGFQCSSDDSDLPPNFVFDWQIHLSKSAKSPFSISTISLEEPMSLSTLETLYSHTQTAKIISVIHATLRTIPQPLPAVSTALIIPSNPLPQHLRAFILAADIASLHCSQLPLVIEAYLKMLLSFSTQMNNNETEQTENLTDLSLLPLDITARVAMHALPQLQNSSDLHEVINAITTKYPISELVQILPTLTNPLHADTLASVLASLSGSSFSDLLPSLIPEEGVSNNFKPLAAFLKTPNSYIKAAWNGLDASTRMRVMKHVFSLSNECADDAELDCHIVLKGALRLTEDPSEVSQILCTALHSLGIPFSNDSLSDNLITVLETRHQSVVQLAADAIAASAISSRSLSKDVLKALLHTAANSSESVNVRNSVTEIIKNLLPLSSLMETQVSLASGGHLKSTDLLVGSCAESLTNGLSTEALTDIVSTLIVPEGLQLMSELRNNASCAVHVLSILSAFLCVTPTNYLLQNKNLLTAARSVMASSLFIIGNNTDDLVDDEAKRNLALPTSYLTYRLVCIASANSKNPSENSDGMGIIRSFFTESTEVLTSNILLALNYLQAYSSSVLSSVLLIDALNVLPSLEGINFSKLRSLVGDISRGLESCTASKAKIVRRAASICRANWHCISV